MFCRVYDKWKQLHEETKQKLETDNSDRLAQFKLVQRITRYWPKFKQDFLDRSKEHKGKSYYFKEVLTGGYLDPGVRRCW